MPPVAGRPGVSGFSAYSRRFRPFRGYVCPLCTALFGPDGEVRLQLETLHSVRTLPYSKHQLMGGRHLERCSALAYFSAPFVDRYS
jgi:hypothetical protein